MNPGNGASIVGGAVLWIAIIVRWKRLSQHPARDLLIAYMCLATVAFFADLSVYETIERLLPGHGLTAGLRDLLVIVAIGSLCNWVIEVDANQDAQGPAETYRQQVHKQTRRRLNWTATAALAVVSLLPWLDPPRRPTVFPVLSSTPDWLDNTWRTPVHIYPLVVAALWAIYVSGRSAIIHARAETGPIRVSLYIVAAGTVLCIPFVAFKAATAALWITGHGPQTITHITQGEQAGQAISLSLVGIGSISAVILMQRERRAATRVLSQIHPLWLLVPPNLRTPATGDPIADLTEQTSLINDLFLDLTAYGSNSVREAAYDTAVSRSEPSAVAHAQADAAWLSDALAGRATNVRSQDRSTAPASSADLTVATQRLVAIARQWRSTSSSTGELALSKQLRRRSSRAIQSSFRSQPPHRLRIIRRHRKHRLPHEPTGQ